MSWQVGPRAGNLPDPQNSLRTHVFREYMTDQRNRKSEDRALGMDRPITRRDFLNGIAIGATAAAAAPLLAAPLTGAGIPPLPVMR